MTRNLVWVRAPHFTAGLTIDGDRIVEAAPILRWTLSKTWRFVRRYFSNKGYEVVVMADPSEVNWYYLEGVRYCVHCETRRCTRQLGGRIECTPVVKT